MKAGDEALWGYLIAGSYMQARLTTLGSSIILIPPDQVSTNSVRHLCCDGEVSGGGEMDALGAMALHFLAYPLKHGSILQSPPPQIGMGIRYNSPLQYTLTNPKSGTRGCSD